jgi:hypothetical protein
MDSPTRGADPPPPSRRWAGPCCWLTAATFALSYLVFAQAKCLQQQELCLIIGDYVTLRREADRGYTASVLDTSCATVIG